MTRTNLVLVEKFCRVCNNPFSADKQAPRAVYCSNACRNKGERAWQRTSNGKRNKRLSNMLSSAKHRSALYGRAIDIDIKYLTNLWEKQDGRCALTKEPFSLEYSDDTKHVANSPSLDQIVPGGGYIKGNVRLVSYQCNVALNQWGEDRLFDFCKMYLDNYSGRTRG